MLDPITGHVLTNISCRQCKRRHPSQWSCQLAQDIAQRQQRERMFVEAFFALHPEPEMDALIRWIQDDTTRAAELIRRLKDENMNMLVTLNEYSWERNPDRMGK